METILPLFERLGTGVGFGLVCMWFYRKDMLLRESQLSLLLTECMAVIKQNSSIIAEHTALLKQYLEDDHD